jgi:DNA-directed RNA polymerase subunit RPC12/RpoP
VSCPRCGGLLVEERWDGEDGSRGMDVKCVQCGHRVGVGTESGYTPVRPVEAQGRWAGHEKKG